LNITPHDAFILVNPSKRLCKVLDEEPHHVHYPRYTRIPQSIARSNCTGFNLKSSQTRASLSHSPFLTRPRSCLLCNTSLGVIKNHARFPQKQTRRSHTEINNPLAFTLLFFFDTNSLHSFGSSLLNPLVNRTSKQSQLAHKLHLRLPTSKLQSSQTRSK